VRIDPNNTIKAYFGSVIFVVTVVVPFVKTPWPTIQGVGRGVVLKLFGVGMGTQFPHQIKRKNAPNSSNKVSIRLQEFPHWIFLFH